MDFYPSSFIYTLKNVVNHINIIGDGFHLNCIAIVDFDVVFVIQQAIIVPSVTNRFILRKIKLDLYNFFNFILIS